MNVPVRAATDLRLLRAAVFSAVCVALSATGHVLASGTGIPLWSWAAGSAAVLCVVGPLAGRERSLPGIAVTLVAGEVGLHLLFCLGQGSAAPAPADRSGRLVALAQRCGSSTAPLTPRRAARLLRQAGIDPVRATGGALDVHGVHSMAGMAGHGAHPILLSSMLTLTPPMLAAHLAATLVAGWLLRRCEVALWQAVRLPTVAASHLARLALLGRLRGLLTAVRMSALVTGLLKLLLSALVPRRTRDGAARRQRPAVLWTCVVRRGPPAVAAVA